MSAPARAGEERSTGAPRPGAPVQPTRGRLRPLGIGEVTITGGFWGERQRRNASEVIPHSLQWMDRTGAIGNFAAARDRRLPAERRGREFADSDVHKLLEAITWESARTGDAELAGHAQRLTAVIRAAQDPDGYLNTNFGRPGQRARYSDLEWGHELYCYGHLIQAAVAGARRADGGGDSLVALGRGVADHVCEVFGRGGLNAVDGHPGIETALVEFARVTGDQRYLDQAALLLARRGRGLLQPGTVGLQYFLDELPVRQARTLRGHAVRALYLAAGAVDVAVETEDAGLLQAVAHQWEATVARRTHLTGGMGSRPWDEAFGEDFELPPDHSYSETCAGVASIMLAWRLLLATGETKYADLIERTLYNIVATAVAQTGRSFFYSNTLHQRTPQEELSPDHVSIGVEPGTRAPWFEVACCPPNVARLLATLGGYLATADHNGLQLHQYAPAIISTKLDDGAAVAVAMRTDYPAGGEIAVEILATPARPWTLTLRVPGWAAGAFVTYPDERRASSAPGSVAIRRTWAPGDVVTLRLPVRPRFTMPDPRIDAVRGCVAVERGPLVYCLESADLTDGAGIDDVRVRLDARPGDDGPAADWQQVVLVRATIADGHAEPAPWPYGPAEPEPPAGQATVRLIPYHDRGNRGPAAMRVWLPLAESDGR